MFHCTEGPIWTWRLPQRNMSLSLKVPRSVETRTRLPIREKAGSRSDLATPIWADWATARISALQIGWDAHDDLGRRDRDRRRTGQQIAQIVRRHAEQNAEGVACLAPLCLQSGECREGV